MTINKLIGILLLLTSCSTAPTKTPSDLRFDTMMLSLDTIGHQMKWGARAFNERITLDSFAIECYRRNEKRWCDSAEKHRHIYNSIIDSLDKYR